MNPSQRMDKPFGLIVYGATGYVGSLVVPYLWAKGPQALRWAIAGRSEKRLITLMDSLGPAQPDRKLPHVMVVTLSGDDLRRMASQTRLVLNLVGPFCKYGTSVVEACIEHSTAYVDSTGEHIWTQRLAAQLHEKAMVNKAIIIPQCAVESSPPDLMTLLLARRLRRPLGPMFFAIQHTWTGYSGGTIASILASLETYSLRQMMAAGAARASCIPDAGAHRPYSGPVLPVRRDRFLGNLTFNPSAMADEAVVMRTWSLLQRYADRSERYGERFSFHGYTTTPTMLKGWTGFLGISVAVFCVLCFPPFRWLLRWLSPEPGTGPRVKPGEAHFVEWTATVAADGDEVNEPNALGVMRFNTDVYTVCAILVSEAALTLLDILGGKGQDSIVEKMGGGNSDPSVVRVSVCGTATRSWFGVEGV
ncbi:hypothetical protein N7457_002835 [Penicillium paradoxum]|uniref:uncharacterized protein n=1 Tax=Penicillium paradoxum TaxID=176176 RepID=UPI0025465900|nr:uncharacterized protein N7457_002835 [Penicillium paradoxum]KAJ5787845.1 hypothetical protein N7457_002835 [Penicillium paradoxum]